MGGQYSYIKGMSEAVPAGHLVISDMWCEFSPIWNSNDDFSFFNVSFIWGVLHNFGGNVGMWGSVPTLNSGPYDAMQNATSLVGIGMFPEGIDQNPAYYQFLFDTNWDRGTGKVAPVDLKEWWRTYSLQR